MIRPARAEDAAAIAALWNAMIRDTLATFTTVEKTPDDITALIAARGGAFWIADQGAGLAGFMTFGPFRAGPGYARTVEHSIIVAPASLGRGLAARLMQAGEDGARTLGHHIMIAAISSENPRALRFHEKLGYRQVGHLAEAGHKAGRWLDLILMQKNLAKGG